MSDFLIIPESVSGRVLTAALSLVKRLISGAPKESPQVTNFWNNRPLTETEFYQIKDDFLTERQYDPKAIKRKYRGDLRFHIPILGGWKRYVVVTPRKGYVIEGYWHIGWDERKSGGLSLVRIKGRQVRVLLGPNETAFFGLNRDGTQIPVEIIGSGQIGDGSMFSQLPLH